MESSEKICPKCRLRKIAPERLGSMTSFLMLDFCCQCDLPRGSSNWQEPISKDKSDICTKCRKLIPAQNKIGSITAFFFKDQRCQCRQPERSDFQLSQALTTRYKVDARLKQRIQDKQTRLAKRTALAKKLDPLLAMASAAKVGDVIGGCYELTALAGEGGMGSVFKARHTALNRDCAVKFLAPNMISEDSWRRFKQEAKIIASLNHPTICQIYDLGIHKNSLPFYVMDYVSGRTLEDIILTYGPLSSGAALELMIKVCEGLAYAHRCGVIHKDLKPANVMLDNAGQDNVAVKILDFGISELNEAKEQGRKDRQTKSSDEYEVLGSAAYMSPEQFAGTTLDKTTDIYSLGCTLYELLTGAPPFLEQSIDALEQAHMRKTAASLSKATDLDYSPEIEAITAKCLDKDPERRYQNASELAIDLDRARNGKPLQFANVVLEEEPSHPTKNLKAISVAILSTVLFLSLSGLAISSILTPPKNSKAYQAAWQHKIQSDRNSEVITKGSVSSANPLYELAPFNSEVRNGVPYRKYSFEQDFEIGSIGEIGKPRRQMKGDLDFPSASILSFSPEPTFLEGDTNWTYLAPINIWEVSMDKFKTFERMELVSILNGTTPRSLVMRNVVFKKSVSDLAKAEKIINIDLGHSSFISKQDPTTLFKRKPYIRIALDGMEPETLAAVLKTLNQPRQLLALRIDDCHLNDSVVDQLLSLKALRTLEARNCDVNDKILKSLAELTDLQRLHLGTCGISTKSLGSLTAMKSLKLLSISNSTDAATVKVLRKALKEHDIELEIVPPKETEADLTDVLPKEY